MLQTGLQVEQACRQMAAVTYNLAYNTTTQDFLIAENPEERVMLNTMKNSLFETVRSMNAHIEMVFIAETFVKLAMKEHRDSSRQENGDENILTHGQVIQGLFIAGAWIEHVTHQGKTRILIKFDTTSDMFSRIILRLWPDIFQLLPWPNCNLLLATALVLTFKADTL